MALEREIAWFETERGRLVEQHFGKFLVIKGERTLGAFDSAEAAYEAGVNAVGLDDFLVKQAMPSDPIEQLPAVWVGSLRASI